MVLIPDGGGGYERRSDHRRPRPGRAGLTAGRVARTRRARPTWSATVPISTGAGQRHQPTPARLRQPRRARARAAASLAAAGRRVAVVSSGDPRRVRHGGGGVRGDRNRRGTLARARREGRARRDGDAGRCCSAGAPLGADFCAISLSDNLKSWATIERRLEAAAKGDFVIALYNPASRARPHQLGAAFALLRQWKPADTVVLLAHAAGTDKAIAGQQPRWGRCARRRHAHAGAGGVEVARAALRAPTAALGSIRHARGAPP